MSIKLFILRIVEHEKCLSPRVQLSNSVSAFTRKNNEGLPFSVFQVFTTENNLSQKKISNFRNILSLRYLLYS